MTGADTFVVGLEHRRYPCHGRHVQFALMSIDPAPAARGDNTWIVQVNRVTDGVVAEAVDGATISVSPFMPRRQGDLAQALYGRGA